MADPVLDAIDMRISQALAGKTSTYAKVVTASPLVLIIHGETLSTAWPDDARLSHYTPTANDIVALQRFGSRWTIVGKFA